MNKISTSKFLSETSKEFSIYTCQTRAIPLVADGLKVVQRVSLWVMRNNQGKIKTVALGGSVTEQKLYVHGDASINQAIGLLAAPYKNNAPLLEGLGQFGSRVYPDKEGIGAPRYTEVRKSKVSEAILYKDLDLVPTKDNYDGSNQEPCHFLPLIPVVLLNGVKGIAVGWSTNILPRSLQGLVQATLDALVDAKTIRGLEPSYNLYDLGINQIASNQYEFTGRATIDDTSSLTITELPPGISVDDFRKHLIDLEDKEEIVSFLDKTKDTVHFQVKMKRGSVKDWTEQNAIDFFKIKERVTERIVVVSWDSKSIKQYENPSDLVRDFVSWRLGWYTKRYERLRDLATDERSYWTLIDALFESGFTNRFKGFENKADMVDDIERVASRRKVPVGDNLDRALNLPSYKWTKEFQAEVKVKMRELEDSITEYNEILASPERLKKIYISEVSDLKKLKV